MMSGISDNTAIRCNPYIGPRPFKRDDKATFKGRDEEITILEGLVLSKRVVLLFAQSGAGKSSILEAGLIPRLIEQKQIGRGRRARVYQKMMVLPTLSVGGSFSKGTALPESNIYLYLALSSLAAESDLKAPETYENLSAGLKAYFEAVESEGQDGAAAADGAATADYLLIFDQFEELFTGYTQRWQDRADFFKQVEQALGAYPRLHVLFAMRADSIHELTPYARLLPGSLRDRYRLEPLDEENALLAVTEPAELCGRHYAPGVAEDLVQNLGRVPSDEDQADVSEAPRGEAPLFIEPLHLQIVCKQLWENIKPPNKTVIEAGDVLEFGNVDQVLKDFYNQTIEKVVKEAKVNERHLRNWFNDDLIMANRTRAYFSHDDIASAQVSEEAMRQLGDAYIIRRSADDWYRLAHDRMVGPILAANAEWDDEYLKRNPLAAAYAASVNDPTFVLSEAQLDSVREYAEAHPDDVLPEEKEFLEDSIGAEQARKMRRRLISIGVALALLAAVIMAALAWEANRQRGIAKEQEGIAIKNAEEAEEQRATAEARKVIAETNEKLARSRELAAEAVASLTYDPELGILLALQGLETAYTGEAENALRQAMQTSRIDRRFTVPDHEFLSVDVSPDGSRLAAVGEDGLVRIWDIQETEGEKPPLVFPDQLDEDAGQPISAVVFHPDGAELATAHKDGSFRVWDAETGELLLENIEGQRQLIDLVYSADGSRIITANSGHIVSGAVENRDIIHPFVRDVAVSPDGRWLATAGKKTNSTQPDGAVKLWDLQNLSSLPNYTLEDHADIVWAVAFSPDGRRMATAGQDKEVIVWDISGLENGQEPQILYRQFAHTNTIADLRFSANSRCLVSAAMDRTSKVWDVESGGLLRNLTGHIDWVQGVDTVDANLVPQDEDLPPELICGQLLATVSEDGTVRLWNLGPAYEGPTMAGHTKPVESADFNSSGDLVVTAADDDRAIVWDAADGRKLYELIDPELDSAHSQRLNRAVFSPDDALIATAGWDNVAKLWDADTGDLSQKLEGHTDRLESVAFNREGTLLATASDDGTARIWSVPDGQCLAGFVHSESGNREQRKVFGVRFHPQEPYLVTSGGDGAVRGWLLSEELLAGKGSCADPDDLVTMSDVEIPADDEACEENAAGCTVNDVVFNAEGSQLASVGWDGSVILREFPGGTILQEFDGHTDRLYGVQFAPDGQTLATSGADGTVRIWDVQSGQVERILPGPEFNYLDFSDDGQSLTVGGEDGTARIYTLDLERLVALAQERLTRTELTEEECERFALQETAVCP